MMRWPNQPPKIDRYESIIDADSIHSKTIYDLDDYTLHYIFCHMESLDFCALYYTSERFREIATNIFRINFKEINVRPSNAIRSRITLLTFGELIEKMILTYEHIGCVNNPWMYALCDVPELCTNLKQLILTKATIDERTIELCSDFFNQLEIVGFRNCEIITDSSNLFGNNLKKLLIFEEDNELPIILFSKNFSNLREIVVDSGKMLKTIMEHNDLIENVRILSSTKFDHYFDKIDYSNVKYLTIDCRQPTFLNKKLTNLINLKMNDVRIFLQNISNLKEIEYLSIDIDYYSALLLNANVEMNNLKSLKLKYASGDYYINRYLKYFAEIAPNLESLACRQAAHVDFIKIIKTMKNLQRIVIDSSQIFDDAFFQSIALIYKQRKSIKLQFIANKNCLNVKKSTCKQYDKYFEIKILERFLH